MHQTFSVAFSTLVLDLEIKMPNFLFLVNYWTYLGFIEVKIISFWPLRFYTITSNYWLEYSSIAHHMNNNQENKRASVHN